LLLSLLSLQLGLVSPAHAETADDLACMLSPEANPSGYRSWWDTVPTNSTYADWFWFEIVPNATTSCRSAVRDTFWNRAVPENWADVPNIGGWSWSHGGFYTQWFWLHAVPDNWADVPDIGGWPWPSGGYYTQWFWSGAVPDNWASQGNFTLGRDPIGQAGQGYYRYHFWEGAVPGNWRAIANIGGWLWPWGGYYTQWFWLHAAPDEWVLRSEFAIGGDSPKGYYDFWFYHYAAIRDFAWDPNRDGGSGYYDYWFHDAIGANSRHYQDLLSIAGGFLPTNRVDRPVSTWFDPTARAVVILTFDHETLDAGDGCWTTSTLRNQGVPATFNLTGYTAAAIEADPNWKACLEGFDLSIGNHTQIHPGAGGLLPRTLMNTFPSSEQLSQFTLADESIHRAFPTAEVNSFRTPWCDGRRSFDVSTADAMLASASQTTGPLVLADSSVNTVSRSQSPLIARGMQRFSLDDYPYPFTAQRRGNRQLIEVPFSYPSDWVLGNFHGIEPTSVGPVGSATASGQWKAVLEDVYARQGVMAVLLHPQLQRNGAALNDFIVYAKSKPGVIFSTVSEVAARFAPGS
jgi:hypothetical protein